MTEATAPLGRVGTTAATTDVLVAGTAGGVGTTTVAALLFSALGADAEGAGAPLLLDHSGGELGLRLPEGDDVRHLDRELALHDLGPHARAGVARLAERQNLLVLVAPATPAGCADIDALVEPLAGQPRLQRILVVTVAVFGRHRIGPRLAALGRRIGVRSVFAFPQDRALAAGGRIPAVRLGPHTVRVQAQLAEVLTERLRAL